MGGGEKLGLARLKFETFFGQLFFVSISLFICYFVSIVTTWLVVEKVHDLGSSKRYSSLLIKFDTVKASFFID